MMWPWQTEVGPSFAWRNLAYALEVPPLTVRVSTLWELAERMAAAAGSTGFRIEGSDGAQLERGSVDDQGPERLSQVIVRSGRFEKRPGGGLARVEGRGSGINFVMRPDEPSYFQVEGAAMPVEMNDLLQQLPGLKSWLLQNARARRPWIWPIVALWAAAMFALLAGAGFAIYTVWNERWWLAPPIVLVTGAVIIVLTEWIRGWASKVAVHRVGVKLNLESWRTTRTNRARFVRDGIFVAVGAVLTILIDLVSSAA